MIIIKTPEQIAGIRASSRLAARTLAHLEQFVVPGVATSVLDEEAKKFMADHGAKSATLNYTSEWHAVPFPGAICTSINEVICHGVPNDRILNEGDIIKIDVTTILDGYFGDTCVTFPVGRVTKRTNALLEATKDCLRIGINEVRPGNKFGNIGYAIMNYAKACGYSIVYHYTGHGTGLQFHEEPTIPNCALKNSGEEMKPGMTFTIEPMLNQGKPECVIDESDHWSARTIDGKLSAQFEHTVLVTETGVEILTLAEADVKQKVA